MVTSSKNHEVVIMNPVFSEGRRTPRPPRLDNQLTRAVGNHINSAAYEHVHRGLWPRRRSIC
jgi:hypothetical protein